MDPIAGRLREDLPSLLLIWGMLLITSMAVLQADLVDGMHVLPCLLYTSPTPRD